MTYPPGMGAGLAMKRGNARGVKAPTARRPVQKRDRRYAKSGTPMSTNIARIGEKARKEPGMVFTSLFHHISDVDNLRACFKSLNGRKAVGVDNVTKEEYGRRLEENLHDLSERLKRGGYRPRPSRRSYIPKSGSEKGRPLGISSFEDKIVEASVKRTLEGIYEACFEDSSYGFRPGRNQHQCLDRLGRTIQQKRVSYVVEADVKSFFDRVNHDWTMRFLEHRIKDRRVLRLIKRMLNAGVMEGGLVRASEEGTPQGSILSPLLSNIYLHYVLDLWFARRVKRRCKGEAYYFRFADDFLACFQYKEDAERFKEWLGDRLEGFALELAEEKTRCLEFGRFAATHAARRGKRPETFTFLGFLHYGGRTQAGRFKLKRRTNGEKLRQSLQRFDEWVRKARCRLPKGELLRQARVRVVGHIRYYGITDNDKQAGAYVYWASRLLFKWVNRKSQRHSYTWTGFRQALAWVGWPTCVTVVNLSPFQRTETR